MKRGFLIILLLELILIGSSGCTSESNSEKEKFGIGYTLDDGRYLTLTFEPPYNNTSVGEDLFKNELSLYDFLKELKELEIIKDGGSRIYEYNKSKKVFGNENFYVAVCNSIDGNRNIYVAKNKSSLDDKCHLKINDIEGISMSIKDGSLSNKGMSVIIVDESDRENIYGMDYKIEKQENGVWQEVKPLQDLLFLDIGYERNEENRLEFDINWENAYGKLPAGNYRLLKSFGEPGEGTEHFVAVEFQLD